MIVREHIWRTADGRFVPTGHPDAAFLFHAAGTEMTDHDAERNGVAAYLKSREKPQDKAMARPLDKGRIAPGGK